VQGNYSAGNLTFFLKFTATDASDAMKVEDDIGNNEPRFLFGMHHDPAVGMSAVESINGSVPN
jgi:hypothetical protein